MLDQIQMALRRYEQLAPNTSGNMSQSQADELADWLEFQVGDVVAHFLARPGFRRRARWPIDRLTGQWDCHERDAVRAVDASLVRYAEGLLNIARSPAIERELLRMDPYQNQVKPSDASVYDPPPEEDDHRRVPLRMRQVEYIASRPWRDLVSVWDYFCPVSQMNLSEVEQPGWSQFTSFCNKTLRTPGNYVARCMAIRIEHWELSLRQFAIRCQEACRWANALSEARALSNLSAELASHIAELRRLALNGRGYRTNDACIALLQIHVGFHPQVDVSWLGEVARLVRNAADIPLRLRRYHQWEIPERAASALVEIAAAMRQPLSPEDVIAEKRSTKRLVLIEEERNGYFDGEAIDKDTGAMWHGRDSLHWELLWTLAELAQLRKNVDAYQLSNPKADRSQSAPSSSAIKNRRSDLKKLLIPKLNARILEAGRGTYRLDLEPDDICLLGWFSEDRLGVLAPADPRPTHAGRPHVKFSSSGVAYRTVTDVASESDDA